MQIHQTLLFAHHLSYNSVVSNTHLSCYSTLYADQVSHNSLHPVILFPVFQYTLNIQYISTITILVFHHSPWTLRTLRCWLYIVTVTSPQILPLISITLLPQTYLLRFPSTIKTINHSKRKKRNAIAGNRTRAWSVAGTYLTTWLLLHVFPSHFIIHNIANA